MMNIREQAQDFVRLGQFIIDAQKNRTPGPYDPATTAFIDLNGVDIKVRLRAKEGHKPDEDDRKLLDAMMRILAVGVMKEGQDIAKALIEAVDILSRYVDPPRSLDAESVTRDQARDFLKRIGVSE